MTIDDIAAQAAKQLEGAGGIRQMWSLILSLKKMEREGLKALADECVLEPVTVSLDVEHEYNDQGGTYRRVRATVYDPSGDHSICLDCDPTKDELLSAEDPEEVLHVLQNFKGTHIPAIPGAPEIASEADFDALADEISEDVFDGLGAIWEWMSAVGESEDEGSFQVGE